MTDHELQDERRRNDTLVLALMQEVRDTVNRVEKRLNDHITEEEAVISSMMTDAFPDGDPEGHRRHHEAEIKRIEDRAKFWGEMRNHLAKWGVVGLAGWLVYVVWVAVLKGPIK